MAWATTEAKGHTTREDWDAFASGLQETRKHVWGERPWPNVDDNDAFLAHVRNLANVFANSQATTGVRYERRRTDPLVTS